MLKRKASQIQFSGILINPETPCLKSSGAATAGRTSYGLPDDVALRSQFHPFVVVGGYAPVVVAIRADGSGNPVEPELPLQPTFLLLSAAALPVWLPDDSCTNPKAAFVS